MKNVTGVGPVPTSFWVLPTPLSTCARDEMVIQRYLDAAELLALCYCLCWFYHAACHKAVGSSPDAAIFFYFNVYFGNSKWCQGWPRA